MGTLSTDRRKNLLLLIPVLALILGLSEVALHAINKRSPKLTRPAEWALIPEQRWIEYHPILGWFHEKNKTAILRKSNYEVTLRTNSMGIRGTKEYALDKPHDKQRMVALGDSFTFGFGVNDDETFPAQLEKANPSLEVLNFGISGYGIDQIHLLLKEKIFDWNPDVILLTIYPEDFWRATRAFSDGGYGKPYFVLNANGRLHLMHVPVPTNRDFKTPQFPEILQPTWMGRILNSSEIVRLLRKSWTYVKKKTGWEDPDTTPEWILGRAILRQLIAEIRERKIRLILMIAPPHRWVQGTVEPIRDSLLRFSSRENVEMIDLSPLFKEASKASSTDYYYIPEDQHWTSAGNRLVAERILSYLKESHS